MAKHAGRNGRILLASTGTGVPTQLLGVSTWSLDMSQDTIETTEFGDTNKTYVVGLKDISGSFDGFWNDAETKLFAAAQSADGTFMYLYPDITVSPTKYAYGPAWISPTMDNDVGDAVKISADFSANGAWGVTF